MIKLWKEGIKGNTWFFVLTLVSLAFLIASWIVPPMGVIDGSTLAAVGEIMGIMSIGTVLKALESGKKASVKTNNGTEITVNHIEKDPIDNYKEIL